MRARFYCDNCGAGVPFNAERCPNCGKHFTAVKCPQCGYEGTPREFGAGCPVCGYLSDELVEDSPAREEKRPAAVPVLSRAFVRIATVVLLVALAVLLVVLLRL